MMSVLHHLSRGRDFTRYGLQAAITRASADIAEYERATELERLGGRIILLPPSEWDALLEGLPQVPPMRLKAAS
jgi:hypothetical protein